MGYEVVHGVRGPSGFWSLARMMGQQRSYRCGHCASDVASNLGFCTSVHEDGTGDAVDRLLICPKCGKATLFQRAGSQTPLALPGRSIDGISEGGSEGVVRGSPSRARCGGVHGRRHVLPEASHEYRRPERRGQGEALR